MRIDGIKTLLYKEIAWREEQTKILSFVKQESFFTPDAFSVPPQGQVIVYYSQRPVDFLSLDRRYLDRYREITKSFLQESLVNKELSSEEIRLYQQLQKEAAATIHAKLYLVYKAGDCVPLYTVERI